ncbi:hypothetical protein CBS101457_003983 [Exobasidium rhododendri]|nr:hypothetical protein CBS101457_003983 [Exobasidium rhododendri]
MTISASSNALARLEPFLLLGKKAHGAAAAKLVSEVTAAPGCYVFSELLALDGIKELKSDKQYAVDFRTLDLFAYGDLEQYRTSAPGTFALLTQVQLNKLRQLTLVSLASRSRALSYSTLIRSLGLSGSSEADSSAPGPSSHISARDIRALEDLIIEAIYAGILSARLDQREQRVEVESVLGRDVRGIGEIEKMSSVLEEWSSTTDQLLASLSGRIEQARKSDEDKTRHKANQDDHLRNLLMQIANNPQSSGGGGGGLNGYGSGGMSKSNYDRMGSDRIAGEMDLDDDVSSMKKKK